MFIATNYLVSTAYTLIVTIPAIQDIYAHDTCLL